MFGHSVDLVTDSGLANPYFRDRIVAERQKRAARFPAGKTSAEYSSGEFLRSAVERQFEIIGEALSRFFWRAELDQKI